MRKDTETQIRKLLPYLREIRHRIHQNPEIKHQEFDTADLVERELAEAGVPTERLGKTGVIGLIKGAKGGKTIALRADMDALPMQELTGLAYASSNDCMHACGHDGHTTILIGAARVLAGMTGKLAGNVKLIFQPAEEGGAGAKILCDMGVMSRPKVSQVYGLHCFNPIPAGAIGVLEGPMTACADQFYITVKGKGAHGAYPDVGIDPIVAACEIVTAIQTIVSREVPPRRAAVVTVGTIHGGTASNIIPEKVELSGTMRSYDPDVRLMLIDSLKRVSKHVASAVGARATVRISSGYPATVNDKSLCDVVRRAGAKALGAAKVIELQEGKMGAEDFSYYLDYAPGAFFRLGTGDGSGKQAPGHNPYFDFNDKAIATGVKMFVAIAQSALV